MGLEVAPFVDDLVPANPLNTDDADKGDDHLRLIKAALQATFPNADHAIYLEQAQADVASATPNIGAAASNYVRITGTTAIAAFDTVGTGVWRFLRFAGALTISHNAAIILPGAANITTAAGATALAMSLGAGNWIVLFYQRADGAALVMDIAGLTAEAAPDGDADYIPFYDTSAGANRKLLLDNLLKIIAALTEDTTPDVTADFFAMYDTSASLPKKVLPNSVFTAWKAAVADLETATSDTKFVTPLTVQNHPGVAKCWAYITVSGGAPSLAANYNITSIADTGVGKVTVTIGTDFSTANWAATIAVQQNAGGETRRWPIQEKTAQAAGSIVIACTATDASFADPDAYHFAGFGEQ